MKTITGISAAVMLTVLALAGCGSHSGTPAAAPTVTVTRTVTQTPAMTPSPAPTVTITKRENQAAPSRPPTAPGANHIITRFSGSGTQNTATFTTPSNWHLSWSYWGCPGGSSNFIVTEYNADGSIDPNGISVNELGTGRGPVATYAYGDAGSHYLSVNTEGCNWSLVPVSG
jgi:hypothetical protein